MSATDRGRLDHYVTRWELSADGAPIITRNARLLPVRRGGEPAMLKLALEPEERAGAALMSWWRGRGAARVLAEDGAAILMERSICRQRLGDLARSGRDQEAIEIICDVVADLHAPRPDPWPELVPLATWFRALEPAARTHGGFLTRAARVAQALLSTTRDASVLHGDVHHGNILDFGPRGWLAVDPKGLLGERGFDYANVFCNPDLDDPSCTIARTPEVFAARVAAVIRRAGLERRRLLQWILAWAGLSVWLISESMSPAVGIRIGELAAAELGRH